MRASTSDVAPVDAGAGSGAARVAARAAAPRRNRGEQAMRAERAAAMARLLARNGLLPFAGRRILEIGCGSGEMLASLGDLGALPEHLYGVDLCEGDIARARAAHPGMHWQRASGAELELPTGLFGLVVAFSLLSAVPEETAAKLAAEIGRVLHPEGAVLWYDARRAGRRKRGSRRTPLEDVKRYFPGWRLDVERITLVPALARRLGFATRLLYPVLAGLPPLRTHQIGVLRRPPPDDPAEGR